MLQYPKDEIYVCGHSLGENLAYMGGGFGLMLDAKRIKNIGVCNAYGMVEAPLAHRYDNIKDNLKAYKERVKNYRVEGDVVSKENACFLFRQYTLFRENSYHYDYHIVSTTFSYA